MARVTHVKAAQQRYETKPVIDAETGQQKIIALTKKDGSPKTTKKGRPITVRATVEDRTKPKPMPKCGKCGTTIEVGQPYKWVKTKSGPYGGAKKFRCAACPSWRPSELTGSAALGTLYAAQESAEDDLTAWEPDEGTDALEAILTTLAEGIREAAQVYEESADNMEEGFGHETYQSSELREKAEALNAMADEVEQAGDFEEFDEEAAWDEAILGSSWEPTDEVPDYPREEDPEGLEVDVDQAKEDYAGEQRTKVEDAMAEVYAP